MSEVDDNTAAEIIGRLETAVNNLAELAERGSIPKELLSLGMRQYRQIVVKPYRIIYETLPETVVVHAVLYGRRDMQTLLVRRILR